MNNIGVQKDCEPNTPTIRVRLDSLNSSIGDVIAKECYLHNISFNSRWFVDVNSDDYNTFVYITIGETKYRFDFEYW